MLIFLLFNFDLCVLRITNLQTLEISLNKKSAPHPHPPPRGGRVGRG